MENSAKQLNLLSRCVSQLSWNCLIVSLFVRFFGMQLKLWETFSDSWDFFCPFVQLVGSISDPAQGWREGLTEKWGVKHGFRRIYPTPQWVCARVLFMPLHVSAFADYSAAAVTQGETGGSRFHFSNKFKFLSLFLSVTTWSRKAAGLYLWTPLWCPHGPRFSETCTKHVL